MFQIDDIDFDEDLDEKSFKGNDSSPLTVQGTPKKNPSQTSPFDVPNGLSKFIRNENVSQPNQKTPDTPIFKATNLTSPKEFISPTVSNKSDPTSIFTPKRSILSRNIPSTSNFVPNTSPSLNVQLSPISRSNLQNANRPSTSAHCDIPDFISDLFGPINGLDANQPIHEEYIHNSKNGHKPTHRQTDKVVRRRKFPGPAGLLPQRSSNTSFIATEDFLKELENESKSNQELEEKEVLSQQSGTLFDNSDCWLALLEELGSTGAQLMGSLNLAVFPKVFKRNLRGCKVPFLAVMVVSVDCALQDPFLQLKDTTGEMSAILHRDVWETYNSEICPGSVIVLKNVGVISAGVSNRKFILNITENNITSIYYSKPEHNKVQSKVMGPLPSVQDSLGILQEWRKTVENLPATPNRKPPGESGTTPLFNHCQLRSLNEPPEKKMRHFHPPKVSNNVPQQPNACKPQNIFQADDSFIEGLDINEFFCDF